MRGMGDTFAALSLFDQDSLPPPRRRQDRRVRRRLEAPGVRVPDKAGAMLKSQKSVILGRAIPIFCMRFGGYRK